MFLDTELEQFSHPVDKLRYIKIIKKDYDICAKQDDYNKQIMRHKNDTINCWDITINGNNIPKFMYNSHGLLIHANANTPKPLYYLNFKDNVCTCPSFRYKNYQVIGTCKHLVKYKKFNQALIIIEMIRKEHFHNVEFPVKDMLRIILSE